MKTSDQVLAYVICGKRKIPVVVTDYFLESRRESTTFVIPTERHIRTGQPDGEIFEGMSHKLTCKAVVASASFLVNGTVQFPELAGKILSLKRKRFSIVQTTSEEVRGYFRLEIQAVRSTRDFKIIHYR